MTPQYSYYSWNHLLLSNCEQRFNVESYFHRPIIYLLYIFHRHVVSLAWIRMKMKRELLTRMSSLPPNLYVTSRTKRSRWFLTETSQTDPVTRHPLACQSLRRSLSSASSKVHACTAAPSATSSSTTACLHTAHDTRGKHYYWYISAGTRRGSRSYPMPRVPPVTRAVFPWSDHLPEAANAAAMSSPCIYRWYYGPILFDLSF